MKNNQPSRPLAAVLSATPGLPAARRPPKAKLYQRAAQPSPMRLEDRDVAVLEALAEHRFLSGEQLRRLVFTCGPSMVRRRLRTLYDHRLINRVAVVAQPTRGIPPFVYTLSRDGVATLAELGCEVTPTGVTGERLRFINHRYHVNDFRVTLAEATRGSSYAVRGWRPEEGLLMPAANGQRRPEAVRHPRLGPKPVPFLPDGFFELGLPDGGSLAFFVEIDLATHRQAKWAERARLFTVYADPAAGLFRRRFGRETFRLLIVTTPDYRGRSRRDNILTTIERTVGASDLFLATTLPEVRADRLLGAIWRPPNGSGRPVSFLPNAGVRVLPARPPRGA